jgi:NhaP-type Na+/H+ or K+/H+ antiporter
MTSLLSFSLILLITFITIQWHYEKTSSSHRQLLQANQATIDETQAATISDDTKRDGVCKEYLVKFLNGTTDAKDECQGLLNAYQAADCADDKNAGFMVRRYDNGTDDVLIDDFYEAWECCSSIYEFYTQHCHEPQLASYQLLGVVSVLLVCGFFKSLIRALRVEWIPDAAACILVGAIVGGIIKLIDPTMISEKLSFNNNLFLHILLPPIVFQASLSIDKKAFRRDLFPILTFAILGAILSTVVVGVLTHSLTSIGHGTTLPLLDSLLFGALISSIDPVATLGILSAVGVSQTDTLYTLIFGESLLNDGVAIVLFDTLVRHLGDPNVVSRATLHETTKHFVRISLGSVGIGLACGIVCTAYFWALRRKHAAVVEVGIFFCWALIPFYISDGVGFSGIISIMTMGFFLDFFVIGGCQSEDTEWMDYMQLRSSQEGLPDISFHPNQFFCSLWSGFSGKGHLSRRSRHHVGFVAEVIASTMETAIFAYLGLFVFNDKNIWDLRLNTMAIFTTVTSRALMVVILSVLINIFVWLDIQGRLGRIFCSNRNTDEDSVDSMGSTAHVYLDKKTQQILILAGTRGAVSFALVESIPMYDPVTEEGSLYKAQLKAMTSCSILFTVFVFGAWTYFIIKGEKDERANQSGPLAHRLLSAPLISGDDDSEGSPYEESSPLE